VGGEHPVERQVERQQQKLETERHASRDPETLVDRNLGDEDIFDIVENPPRILEKPEFRDTTTGLTKANTRNSHGNRTKLRKDIEEYHLAHNIDLKEKPLETFISHRPDGLAFDKEKNHVYS